MDLDNVDFKMLKEAAKALNEAEGLLAKAGQETLKTIAVKKEVLVANFTTALEEIAAQGFEEEIPEICTNMFNSMYGDAEDAGTGEGEGEVEGEEEAPKEKQPKAKKEKAPKEPKAKKEPKPKKEQVRSCYGHLASAISGKIDTMVAEGTTFGELCDTLEIDRSRVKSHIKALQNKGLTVTVKENEDWKKIEVTVKEKALVQ